MFTSGAGVLANARRVPEMLPHRVLVLDYGEPGMIPNAVVTPVVTPAS